MYCSAENIDMLSTEGFLLLERKSLLQQVAHNEVSALVTLTFYENLLIGQETSVWFSAWMGVFIKQVEFRENLQAFPRDK